MMTPRIVLASGSPRRLELLCSIGWDPTVIVPDIDETVRPGEAAEVYVARLAQDKAATVAGQVDLSDGTVVIAADTTVVIDGVVLGKPADDADATEMIARLAGRDHLVHTGVAAVGGGDRATHQAHIVVTTRVTFVSLTPIQVAAYVARGESMDKAGAYAIQGAGAALVERIEGSPSNVIGLPLAETVRLVEGLLVKGMQ